MRASGGDAHCQDARHRRQSPFFGVNEALLTGFWLVDIAFNANIEFGGEHASSANHNTIMSMVQVLLQICALVTFFALLGATFLFRSGLFSLLFIEFRAVLLVHPAYILLTVFLSVLRVNSLTGGSQLIEIWDVSGYPVLSCIQKLGAVAYYASSVRAVEKLRRPHFYSHEHWMQ